MRRCFSTVACAAFAACGSGPSETGDISSCNGLSVSGQTGFTPLSGLVYQVAADTGAGGTAVGVYEVVLWSSAGDGGSPAQSYRTVCGQLLDGGFAGAIQVAPLTVSFSLPSSITGGSSYQTAVSELGGANQLTDILGGVDVDSLTSSCLTGDFNASLVPVFPADDTPIDGGTTTDLSGTFSLPRCPQ